MLLSAIVCTYKRPDHISALLGDLERAQSKANAGWELLVVDNAGDAQTRKRCHDSPLLKQGVMKYLHEPRAGLSVARNHGVRKALGEWLLFLDDDVRVREDFIHQMLQAIEECENMDVLCPRMVAPLPPDIPGWLQRRVASGVGQFDLGKHPCKLSQATKLPVGACFCMHRRVWKQYGPFEEKMGREGRRLLGGEESLLMMKAFAAGAKGMYLPHILVHHEFVNDKKGKAYWRRHAYDGGRSYVRMQLKLAKSGLASPRLARLALVSAAKAMFRLLVMPFSGRDAFENQHRVLAHLGRAKEACSLLIKRDIGR